MNLGNVTQTTLMLGSMTALLALIGYILAGRDGLLFTALFMFAFMAFGRGTSKAWMLRAINAMKLEADDAPVLHAMVRELSRRAELPRGPDLYFIEADTMLGFSVGNSEEDSAIVFSGALIQGLSAREIASVLAHEISHIAAGDLAVMGLADLITRLTRTLSMLGVVLVVLNIPIAATGGAYLPWGALVLLVMAPMLSFMMQMALSRVREFEADHAAVDICGDPEALAAALEKLERRENGFLRHAFLPHAPGTVPSLLRSHPITHQRVSRILQQSPKMSQLPAQLIDEHYGFPSDRVLAGGWPLGVPLRWLLRWWR